MNTRAPRTDYRGDRPSPIALRLEQRAREARQRDLAGTRPSLWRRIVRLLTVCFTHRTP